MANNNRQAFVRLLGAMVVGLAGLWAAGMTPRVTTALMLRNVVAAAEAQTA